MREKAASDLSAVFDYSYLAMKTYYVWLPLKHDQQLPTKLETKGELKCFPDTSS